MSKVNIKKGSRFIITEGPSTLGIEHSLFDEPFGGATRKPVRFGYQNTYQCDEDWILKFDGHLGTTGWFFVKVVAVFRNNPNDSVCGDWILWGLEGGTKFIIHYSTATRVGCARWVDNFPEY